MKTWPLHVGNDLYLFIYYKIVHEVQKYIVMQYLKNIYIDIKLCNSRDST